MRLPARPSSRQQPGTARLAAGRLARSGGSQGSSLLDDAQSQAVPWITAWRWQLAQLSLALARCHARACAARATGDAEQLAGDLTLYLARYCLGFSLRDLAATAQEAKNTVARAVDAIERLQEGQLPSRYGMRTPPPAPFWTALEQAEQELEQIRDAIVASAGAAPVSVIGAASDAHGAEDEA